MGVWEFVLVYLAAFVLVQLALYRYLRGRSGERSRMAFAGPPNADQGPGEGPAGERGEPGRRQDPSRRSREDDPDRTDDDPFRRCPNCGATNEPDGPYTFCRSCASRLPG